MKIGLIASVLIFLTLGSYTYVTYGKLQDTRSNLAQTTLSYEEKVDNLTKDNEELIKRLEEEKERNDNFEDQIDDIEDAVGDLEKLKKLDKELLQKYSKVYFLNEHYEPKTLSTIDEQYVLASKNPQKFHGQALPFLEEMFDEAKKDGFDLKVVSAYRSFYTQTIVKQNHKITYGYGANQFSADQGYSEHQLGTTLDLTTAKLGANFDNIDKDPAYKWLQENAHKYGFILSYPQNNAYYIFEPWHWRFVGVALAKKLNKDGKSFYDEDQRTIDSYLIKIFD